MTQWKFDISLTESDCSDVEDMAGPHALTSGLGTGIFESFATTEVALVD